MEDCKRENRTKYVFMEILAVAFLATGGIFVRSCGIDSINCAFYRILFSILFIYKFAKKHFSLLSKKDVAILLASGVFFATDITVANVAFKCTSIANVNLLCNLTPLTIIPITYFVFKERIPKFYYVGVAVALVGVVLLISGKTDPTASSYFGDLLGFASSMFYLTGELRVPGRCWMAPRLCPRGPPKSRGVSASLTSPTTALISGAS